MKRPDWLRLLALLILILGVVYFYLNIFFPKLIPNIFKLAIVERPLNILVLGTDVTHDLLTRRSTSEVGRADTVVLIHYDPLSSKVSLLSIPRDSYVDIPGYYPQKINAAYVLGRVELTRKVVENLTGVKIDKYIILNTRGIVKLVDLLGGITVDIDKDLYYVDRAGKLYINLKAGRRRLSGREAEGFLRFRHDASADLGRISRQQDFLKALAGALASPRAFIKAPFIIEVVLNNMKTDLTLKEFIILGNTARMLELKEILNHTVPGEPGNNQAGSVWLINRMELKKIITRDF
ncbi:MAG: LCP family protein [Candidatus Margulisiibacteriota bacterium]